MYSIYTAEAVAIHKKVDLIINQRNKHHNYIILTDLLSTLQSLDNTENNIYCKTYPRKKIYRSKPENKYYFYLDT